MSEEYTRSFLSANSRQISHSAFFDDISYYKETCMYASLWHYTELRAISLD